MKLSDSYIFKQAKENPGFVIVPDDAHGFLKEFSSDLDAPIWTTDLAEALKFSEQFEAEAAIRVLARRGYTCSIHYYWQCLRAAASGACG